MEEELPAGIFGVPTAEEVKKKIEKVREDVFKKRGEPVLSLREIVVGTSDRNGGLVPPRQEINYFLETGKINGRLIESREKISLRSIPLQSFRLFSCGHPSYMHGKDLTIPVERTVSSNNSFGFRLNFDKEKPEEENEIGFSYLEFFTEKEEMSGYTRNTPYLKEFNLLIGDKEIRNFIRENSMKFFHFDNGVVDNYFKSLKA